MYLLKRVTTVPATPLTIQVDGIPDGSGDGNFQGGGVYLFQPAGQDEDQHQVSEHAAVAIMSDPGLADHFSCDPPLSKAKLTKVAKAEAEVVEAETAAAAEPEPDKASGPKTKAKAKGK